MTAIGINGFGSKGRHLLRAALSDADFRIAAINDPFLDAEQIAHFIRFDTSAGRFAGRVEVKSRTCIAVDGTAILVFNSSDPLTVPWSDAGVSVVLEASGVFTTAERAAGHLNGGAQRVVVCGPSADLPVTVCGVNDSRFGTAASGAAVAAAPAAGAAAVASPSSSSTASGASSPPSPTRASGADVAAAQHHQVFCTGMPILTALGPFLRIVQEAIAPSFTCSFVSVQPPLSSMKCVDSGGVRDLRLGRGQIGNLIAQPAAATSLLKVVSKLFPRLAGRVGGTIVYTAQQGASMLDVTLVFDNKAVRVQDVVDAVAAFGARGGGAERISAVETAAVVSSDFSGSAKSFVLDVGASSQISESSVKIVLWFDSAAACAKRTLDALK